MPSKPLTRQTSQAQGVGTQVTQTKPAGELAALGQGLSQVVQAADVGFARAAEAGTKGEVETLLKQEGIDSVPSNINRRSEQGIENAIVQAEQAAAEDEQNAKVKEKVNELDTKNREEVLKQTEAKLSKADRISKGIEQGTISEERLITELQVVAKKMKARYPGYEDVIQGAILKRTGINPDIAALNLVLQVEESKKSQELTKEISDAYAFNNVKYNNPGDPSSGMDIEYVTRANAISRANAAKANLIAKQAANAPTKEQMIDQFIQTGETEVSPAHTMMFDAIKELTTRGSTNPTQQVLLENVAAMARSREYQQIVSNAEAHAKELGVSLPVGFHARAKAVNDTKWSPISDAFGGLDGKGKLTPDFRDALELMNKEYEATGKINMSAYAFMINSMGPDVARAVGPLLFTPEVMTEIQLNVGPDLKNYLGTLGSDAYRFIGDTPADVFASVRNAMLSTMFPSNDDPSGVVEVIDNLPPPVQTYTIEKMLAVGKTLGDRVLEAPKDVSTWGNMNYSIFVKRPDGKSIYQTRLSGSTTNQRVTYEQMFNPVWNKNLESYAKTQDPDVVDVLVKGRANVARDYLRTLARQVEDMVPGLEIPVVYDPATGKVGISEERAQQVNPSVIPTLNKMQQVVDKVQSYGLPLDTVIDSDFTGIRQQGGLVTKASGDIRQGTPGTDFVAEQVGNFARGVGSAFKTTEDFEAYVQGGIDSGEFVLIEKRDDGKVYRSPDGNHFLVSEE